MAQRRARGRPAWADILTPAEWRITEAVRHGLTNRAIADRSGVTPDAVKYHVSNVLQKLGLPNRVALRQWTGVARHSALSGMEVKMESSLGPVGQISRKVKDIEAARRWYADVLGLPHLYSFGNLAFFDCGGVRLFLSGDDTGNPGESILYFRVGDIHGTHQALMGRGVDFTHAPHMIHRHDDGTEEWMAFFKDAEDRPLAIMAQAAPRP